jgi:protein-S-isoprenylcysteine O-methyltransferase Ste14
MLRPNADLAIYAVHGAFWASFGLTRRLCRARPAEVESGPDAAAADVAAAPATAPWSRALLAVHMVAFGVMYAGVGAAVVPDLVPAWFPGQRVAGSLIIAAGAGLMSWSLLYFRSWRYRAALDRGHELATGGPFAVVRHPIYAGLDLLALGTAVWIPTPLTWIGLGLMVLGGDLRGRAEEALLLQAFGQRYRDYCARTRRLVPGVY